MSLSHQATSGFGGASSPSARQLDCKTEVPVLGAGTIIRHNSTRQVEGLTTAASILFAATVGVCVALSQLVLAVGVTATDVTQSES